VLKQYARIGLVPGQDFDAGKLKADFVKRIAQVAFDRTMLQFKVGKSVKHLNGWIYDSIAYAIYAPRVESTDQIGEGAIAITCNIIRSLCGADWSPTEALLAGRRPADVRPYRDFFRAPVRFDAEQNALVFSAALLRKRLPHAAPELQRLLLEEVRKLDRELALDFPTKVRRVVRAGLIVGQQSAEQTAALFAMQRRTLCRRLRAEGTTFEALVAEIRYEVGRQLLADTRMPIHEIAAAIGYA
jgi:AraC-like DNA-binding protein